MKNKITYAITCCNEHVELRTLLSQLVSLPHISNSQILIQYDSDSVTTEVMEVIYEFKEKCSGEYTITGFPLNKHFANFKNNLFNFATGDWIFQIDADEYLGPELDHHLPYLLDSIDEEIELIRISRINVVNGITQTHIDVYGWQIDSNTPYGNIVNFPDYQSRLYRNIPTIRWKNAVHEQIIGHKAYSDLISYDWSLIHIKDIVRQEKQNQFYSTI